VFVSIFVWDKIEVVDQGAYVFAEGDHVVGFGVEDKVDSTLEVFGGEEGEVWVFGDGEDDAGVGGGVSSDVEGEGEVFVRH